MRYTSAFALTAALALAAAPALAGPPKSKPVTAGPKAPKTAPATKPTAATRSPKAPKTTGPKVAKAPAAPGATKTHPAHAKGPKAPATTPVTGAPGAVAPVTTAPNVPKNPKLAARLQGMLPAGMTVEQAALGFKNQGQFIAAVNVSKNLGIPFVDLKTSMVTDGRSLGQSIQHLKPTLDGDVEAARAMRWTTEQLEQR